MREAFRALVPASEAQLAAERRRDSKPAPGEDPAITAAARAEYDRWRAGKVDFTRYDATMRGALNEAMVQQVAAGIAPLGAPTAFVYRGKITLPNNAGTTYTYRVVTPSAAVSLIYSLAPDGKINGIYFKPDE